MGRQSARQIERLIAAWQIERDNDPSAWICGGGLRVHRVPYRLRQPMQLFAPAKINLRFKILRRREDGFHEIETLMAPISLRDEIILTPNDSGLEFSCDEPVLPAGEDNLVTRAARAFFAETQLEPRVRIELRKKIPHGAGLGGGSSDAASTLLGLNRMHGDPLSRARLTSLGAALGSDVPFFLAQSAAICRGRGEIVEPVAVALPRLPLLLLKPEFGVPTPWAYQHWHDSRELAGVDYAAQSLGEVILENDLERPVFEKYVFLARLKGWLRAQPEVAAALLSGSGSTVFAALREADAADALTERAREELDPLLWTCAATLPS
jgi:4-diphosphocytidyl-2-C-methyl-D-erythritol kinase